MQDIQRGLKGSAVGRRTPTSTVSFFLKGRGRCIDSKCPVSPHRVLNI